MAKPALVAVQGQFRTEKFARGFVDPRLDRAMQDAAGLGIALDRDVRAAIAGHRTRAQRPR